MFYDYTDWHQFNKIARERKLILYGAGKIARRFWEIKEEVNKAIFIIDNNEKLWNKDLFGIPIFSFDKLKEYNPNEVVILITCGDIVEILKQLNNENYNCVFSFIHIIRNRYVPEVNLNNNYKPKYNFDYTWIEKCNGCYAHALGSIDGISYTNSLEAFEHNYEQGFRAFEGDIVQIFDGSLILCHKISKIISYDTYGNKLISPNNFNELNGIGFPSLFSVFKKEKVFGKYKPLTTKDFLLLMDKYSDVYFVLHLYNVLYNHCLGGGLWEYESLIRQLIIEASEINEQILERFIVQVHEEAMLDSIMSIYNFKSVNLIKYRRDYPIVNIIDSCLKTGVKTVTLPIGTVSKEMIHLFNDYGINVCLYAGVIGTKNIAKLKKMGAKVFCVD